jgi:cobalt/nickel transport system permease protein
MSILAYDKNLETSWLGKMETRVKILSIISLLVVFSTIKNPIYLLSGTLILLSSAILTGVSVKTLFKRLLWLIPFAGIMMVFFPFITPGKAIFTLKTTLFTLEATDEGLLKSAFLTLRVLNATFAVSLLVLTTPLQQLLHGLQDLKLPKIMVSLISFTLRYFEVLGDEVKRMQIARKSRGFKRGSSFFHGHTMKTIGLLIGTLFLRAAERGDRIYSAMLSRGYRGETVCCGHCSPKAKDWTIGLGILLVGIGLKLAEWRGIEKWLL